MLQIRVYIKELLWRIDDIYFRNKQDKCILVFLIQYEIPILKLTTKRSSHKILLKFIQK